MWLQDPEGEAEKHVKQWLQHNFLFYTNTVSSGHDLAWAVEVGALLIYSVPHWWVNLGNIVHLNAGTQTLFLFPFPRNLFSWLKLQSCNQEISSSVGAKLTKTILSYKPSLLPALLLHIKNFKAPEFLKHS